MEYKIGFAWAQTNIPNWTDVGIGSGIGGGNVEHRGDGVMTDRGLGIFAYRAWLATLQSVCQILGFVGFDYNYICP